MASQASQVVSNVWDLSLYELHRKPHEMVADSSVVAVSPRALRSELMCPICLDLMKNTLTTKECLHRFCQDCIITALRSGNKECPTCRKKLVSKRSLRPDPNFDSLIAKIYPNREELNAEQERGLSRSRSAALPVNRRKRKAQEMASSSPDLLLHPEEKRMKRVPSTAPSTAPTTPEPELVEEEEEEEEVEEVEEEEVELQLRPHPHDSSVVGHSTRNLSTIPIATAAHLIKYLAISPLLDTDKEEKGSAVRALSFDGGRDHGLGDKKYSLYMQLGEDNEFTVVPNGMTLKQICEMYWLPGDKLKLYFARNEMLAPPPS